MDKEQHEPTEEEIDQVFKEAGQWIRTAIKYKYEHKEEVDRITDSLSPMLVEGVMSIASANGRSSEMFSVILSIGTMFYRAGKEGLFTPDTSITTEEVLSIALEKPPRDTCNCPVCKAKREIEGTGKAELGGYTIVDVTNLIDPTVDNNNN